MSNRGTIFRSGALVTAVLFVFGVTACTQNADRPPEIATATAGVTHDRNERVPDGAKWTQQYFPSTDGSDTELHADVLLPEAMDEGEQVPVILSVGAYFGHAGALLSPDGEEHAGPSDRFSDLIEGADLFGRGYGLVMVDLRGFGGSSGCLDFMGAGEQADVQAAIEWSASQPWSSGSVGMYGKSYDAITGLVGNNLDVDGLDAVVAQSPMWNLRTSVRSGGVPRTTIVDASRSYNETAQIPGMPDDDERYRANAAYETEHPECTVANSAGYQTADPDSEYWATRNLAARATGTDTPLFFTQGLLDSVTAPEGMEEFLANHEGPERGWVGPWDHIRGNDRDAEGVLEMGREGWFEEVMAFYDEHLKGEAAEESPAFSVQDSTGTWRAQDSWPTADQIVEIPLTGGSYIDDGAEGDPDIDTGNSFVQSSSPLASATRITGTPRIRIDATGTGNVMVKFHDVAPDGTSVVFDEQVAVLAAGATVLDLKSTDWTLPEGNALAVEIGTIEAGVFSTWIDTPSNDDIVVSSAVLSLALDDPLDDVATEDSEALFLETYRQASTAEVAIGDATFAIPTP